MKNIERKTEGVDKMGHYMLKWPSSLQRVAVMDTEFVRSIRQKGIDDLRLTS